MRWSADFITDTSESEFSAHTGIGGHSRLGERARRCPIASRSPRVFGLGFGSPAASRSKCWIGLGNFQLRYPCVGTGGFEERCGLLRAPQLINEFYGGRKVTAHFRFHRNVLTSALHFHIC
jgi:hypothetical protein